MAASISTTRVESPLRSYGRAIPTTVVGVSDELASALAALAELQSRDGFETEPVAEIPAVDVVEELDISSRVKAVSADISLHPVEPAPQLRSRPST